MYKRFLTFFLEKLGFRQINADYSNFVINTGLDGPIMSTFIDNIKKIALKKSGMIKWIKAKLEFAFLIADIKLINFYLSFKIEYN